MSPSKMSFIILNEKATELHHHQVTITRVVFEKKQCVSLKWHHRCYWATDHQVMLVSSSISISISNKHLPKVKVPEQVRKARRCDSQWSKQRLSGWVTNYDDNALCSQARCFNPHGRVHRSRTCTTHLLTLVVKYYSPSLHRCDSKRKAYKKACVGKRAYHLYP